MRIRRYTFRETSAMLEKYGLYFYRRLIGTLGGIIWDPRKLMIFSLLLLVSFALSAQAFLKERDEGPVIGKIFSNALWLSFGLGLFVASGLSCAGLLAYSLRMKRLGESLLALGRFAFYPYKLHLVLHHHVPSDASTGLWWFVAGVWGAAFEAAVGIIYCLTLLGIPVGLIHLKLALPVWTPHRYSVFTDIEMDEWLVRRRDRVDEDD